MSPCAVATGDDDWRPTATSMQNSKKQFTSLETTRARHLNQMRFTEVISISD
jgi:hypothetical protein